ncbi:MAG TPA: outer membrane lipoprotein-sorting protein [Gammaproteobacteria bacterium]|nr:outer membrane lipoprotein-sorting protein [Gammaproteobacteria bacterium]
MQYRRFLVVCLILLLCSISFASNAEPATASRARDILRSVDDLWRGKSSHAIMTLKVKTRHYTRTMRLEGWTKGKEKTLLRVLSPKKEKGTITLKSGTSIYSYFPKTDRKIRLTSGMMSGAWMGSHLTNDDLVKEARFEDDYNASIRFEGWRDGQNIIEFVLLPKPDAAVVWGKLVLIVFADSYTPVIQTYYDEDMQLSRTITFSDRKILGGRLRPSVLRVVPADKPEEYTEFIYEFLEMNLAIPDRFFSVSNLRKR